MKFIIIRIGLMAKFNSQYKISSKFEIILQENQFNLN